MATEWVQVRNAQVLKDDVLTHRWYDAVGPSVQKWSMGAANVVSTTTAAGQTFTQTNGTLVGGENGSVVFTMTAADDNIAQVQGQAEQFHFSAKWPAYYGLKFQLVDADQTDLFLGFCITDATIVAGLTDGIYFRTVDQSAVMSFVLEQDSTESSTTIGTLADATDYVAEFVYDPDAGYFYAYLNGALIASVAITDANLPNDEWLTATICTMTGEAAANNVTVYWARAFQVQEA